VPLGKQRACTVGYIMTRLLCFVLLLAAILSGCSKTAGLSAHAENAASSSSSKRPSTDATHVAAKQSLLISPEDMLTLRNNATTAGPSITGSVQPERRADLRDGEQPQAPVGPGRDAHAAARQRLRLDPAPAGTRAGRACALPAGRECAAVPA